ncbi:hypothetical protein BGX26_002146 [Mortierella sp. AD094]|nr:hypothetical protein BGX26_002146 [Mortierella sp. AD094]
MRRASAVATDPPPSSNNGNHDAMAAATAAVSASIAAAIRSPKHAPGLYYGSGGEDGVDDDMGPDSLYTTTQRGRIGENRYVAMATPKAPPMDALTLSKRPPPKSILKKRSSDNNSGNATTIVAPVPSVAGASSSASSILESDVHPMAAADENSPDSKPFTLPTEHRAKLVTNSPPPPPTQPEQESTSPTLDDSDSELVNPLEDLPSSGHSKGSSNSSSGSGSGSSSSSKSKTQDSYSSQKGASTPSDYKPGVQSNQAFRSRGDEISQAEMLNDEMMSVSARAQDLARQYYGYGSSPDGGGRRGSQQGVSAAAAAAAAAANGGRGRSIGFHDRIEVIPAHRKADYNRQSDKNVTFKLLTPEMRCDIRDELNTYKMREMAVHVDNNIVDFPLALIKLMYGLPQNNRVKLNPAATGIFPVLVQDNGAFPIGVDTKFDFEKTALEMEDALDGIVSDDIADISSVAKAFSTKLPKEVQEFVFSSLDLHRPYDNLLRRLN